MTCIRQALKVVVFVNLNPLAFPHTAGAESAGPGGLSRGGLRQAEQPAQRLHHGHPGACPAPQSATLLVEVAGNIFVKRLSSWIDV